MARIVFSANEAYLEAARQELTETFPGATFRRLGPDAGTIDGPDVEEVAAACVARPVVFVRHLFREVRRTSATEGLSEAAVAVAVGEQALALQMWATGEPRLADRPDALRRRIVEALEGAGVRIARGGRPRVLSILLTEGGFVLGLTPREYALADWPGGRVGLARGPEQISRAELKLEELHELSQVELPTSGVALDLGASPGGWSRLLRRRGFEVWAVDPAELDPRAAADPGIRHVRLTAEPFLTNVEDGPRFDLLANDMRMEPRLSSALTLRAAHRLRSGSLAIATLKIVPRGALVTVRSSIETLRPVYELLFARQLFHNRNEVTLLLRRR